MTAFYLSRYYNMKKVKTDILNENNYATYIGEIVMLKKFA